MARIIDGKKHAAEIKEEVRREVEEITKSGRPAPGLAVVLVGSDPASQVYVRNKRKSCGETGINSFEHDLPESATQEEVLALIQKLNRDPKVHGILVQLPLPKHINPDPVIEAIAPEKDVDGFHPLNVGRLMDNRAVLKPCTPAGIMELLRRNGVDPKGKNAVVLGRSNIVGKPIALLLLHAHATVTVCHSRTENLAAVARSGDILIAAIGKANFVTGEMVKEGAVVIDVGINRLEDGSLVGDVDFRQAEKRAGLITPVPGGVGPMTIAMLLKNTLEAYRSMRTFSV